MGQRTKVEGTKIAQVAKDLNVTSVTIRRYLAEFNIKTATDENGIKVLPPFAMEELLEVRRLKEDGLSNPQVLEMLAERRVLRKPNQVEDMEDENISDINNGASNSSAATETAVKAVEDDSVLSSSEEGNSEAASEVDGSEAASDGKAKHALTCQTCGKTFEHTNARLRDCLECYRTKRKERRRGGDKHKNVIQHPIAAQVANKALQLQNARNGEEEVSIEGMAEAPLSNGRSVTDHSENRERIAAPLNQAIPAALRGPVRNYRKAIEETRQITGSLKRRLERPDLHEGERRWLEQIYAYQLILHQGWRHLSEYKSGGEPAKENLE
jgi:DNA-binding transcriptional MerR regulator